MYQSRSHRLGATIAIALTASLAIAVGLATAARTAQAASGTITVAYSKTYVFDADPLSVIWWDEIKKQFEQTYQGAHLELQGYDGTDVDSSTRSRCSTSRLDDPRRLHAADRLRRPVGRVKLLRAARLVPNGEGRALVVGLPGRD
jgi:hypothetical protein